MRTCDADGIAAVTTVATKDATTFLFCEHHTDQHGSALVADGFVLRPSLIAA
jgi:hypothetical protein